MASKQEIYEVIKNNPGIRKRYIAYELNTTVLALLDTMKHMVDQGMIRAEYHHDTANMEFYDEWYIVK